MEFIIISKDNISARNLFLLRKFEKLTYISSFTDSDERESIRDIIRRIRHKNPEVFPQSYCVLALDGNFVTGGLIADWYPNCNAIELSYLAVHPAFRNRRIGSQLLKTSLDLIQDTINQEYGQQKIIRNIFLEVEIPYRNELQDEINPVVRVNIWEKWGARHIPIHYTQPPLSPGKSPASNLMLLLLPYGNQVKADGISATDLKSFLHEFYKGLNALDSIYLNSMNNEIDELSSKNKNNEIATSSLFVDEVPSARIKDAVTTSHFYFVPEETALPNTCSHFDSFECDLMNFANQSVRPIRTAFFGLFKNVKILMPSMYCYTSEGKTHFHVSKNKELIADISLSASFPKTGRAGIAHLSISPGKNKTFNDLDFIKIISTYGSKQENYIASSEIRFIPEGTEEPLTDYEFLCKFIGGNRYQKTCEGVSQFDVNKIKINGKTSRDQFSSETFFSSFHKDESGEPESKVQATLANKMLCGLILGIFDYKRMDTAEIIDTIRPIVVKQDSFCVLCRGHLIKFERQSKDEKNLFNKIKISPYLLIPSAILALNGFILNKCEGLAERFFRHPLIPFFTKSNQAELTLNKEYLENVFQYPSEQEIVRIGEIQRCMHLRHKTLTHKIDISKSREKTSSDLLLDSLIGSLIIFEVIGVINSDDFCGIPNLAMMVLVFIFGITIFRWIRARLQ